MSQLITWSVAVIFLLWNMYPGSPQFCFYNYTFYQICFFICSILPHCFMHTIV